jgi:hypothetical protein
VDKKRGSKNVLFCPRSGYKNCSQRGLFTEGGGVKKWQNSVHDVVVECPLSLSLRPTDFTAKAYKAKPSLAKPNFENEMFVCLTRHEKEL